MLRAFLCSCATALVVAQTAPFAVHTDIPLRTLPSSPYVCVTLDWWPDNKCDGPDGVSDCSWKGANVLTAPVSSPNVKKAMEAFGDVILRIGGTLEDQITYAVGDDADIYCPDFSPPPPEPSKFFTGGCLNSSRWQELMDFCPSTSRCRMLFGINAMRGRECNVTESSDLPTCGDPRDSCTSNWDSSNAASLIRATAAAGFEMLGYELGNELDCLRANQYTESFTEFYSLISGIMKEYNLPMPSVIATDSYEYIPPVVKKFLPQVQNMITAYTWHHYPLHSGIHCTGPEAENSASVDRIIMDPDGMKVLFKLADVLENMVDSVTTVDPPIQLWMGETGGAYNSGCNGSTNAFMSGYWYLPSLAGLAQHGHDLFCRQTLLGGNYELLDKMTLLPNPDYYSAVLYTRLMGRRLLQSEATEQQDAVRIYTHCSIDVPGSVTMLYLNYINTEMVVDVAFDNGLSAADMRRDEYILTPVAVDNPNVDLLHSNKIALNGQLLVPAADGTVPDMSPYTVMNGPIVVPGYSYGYIVFPDANAAACL